MSIFKSKRDYLQDGVGFERKRAILYKSLLKKKRVWLTINEKGDCRKPPMKLKRISGIVTDIFQNFNYIWMFLLDTHDIYPIDSIWEAAFFNFNSKKVRENDYNDGQLGLELWEFGGNEHWDEKYYKTLFDIIEKKERQSRNK
jgi:hypothetical protein